MLCISVVYAVMQCLCVCPSVCTSVTFVDHVKTNKRIFEIFSPSGNRTILVFPYQRGCRYSDWNPPNGGVECSWGIGRNGDSLLSSNAPMLVVPRVHTELARRAFSVAAPSTWNSLPADIRLCENILTCKRHLKTHLFKLT